MLPQPSPAAFLVQNSLKQLTGQLLYLADEKHTRINGEKAYIATTLAEDCVLGASVSLDADADGLTEAYGHFKTEAQNVSPDYKPETVNTDGWTATQSAWQALFSTITVILHSFIKIRDRCKRMKDHYGEIKTRIWEAYHAADPQTFTPKVAELDMGVAKDARRQRLGGGFEAVP